MSLGSEFVQNLSTDLSTTIKNAIANTRIKTMHYKYMDIVLALKIRKRQLSREQLCTAIKLYFMLLEFYNFNLFLRNVARNWEKRKEEKREEEWKSGR